MIRPSWSSIVLVSDVVVAFEPESFVSVSDDESVFAPHPKSIAAANSSVARSAADMPALYIFFTSVSFYLCLIGCGHGLVHAMWLYAKPALTVYAWWYA